MFRSIRFLALLGLVLACQGVFAADGVFPGYIVVGQNITLQGGKNEYGVAVQEGVAVYLQMVNARGGVHGREIRLKTLDDDNQAAKAEANARQLAEKDKVFMLFGSIEGGPSTAVMKAAADLKLPFFGPMAGSPALRRPHQPMVFPVRAEHREEFRALMGYAKSTGGSRVAFVRADTETGQQHLANVNLLCAEMGMTLVADLPFKSDISDSQIAQMAQSINAAKPDVVINHGSSGMYGRLILSSRTQGFKTNFSGVNSGSTQLAHKLGPAARGMVFSQVVPSPWERKTAITREYQEEFTRQKPGREFSYGSLEGYLTAKALVLALNLAGKEPTRESLVRGLHKAASLDINGLRANYTEGAHAGMTAVDLSIVTQEGKFRH